MKFILNEKFILDERFILTEAEDDINTLKENALKAIEDNFNDSLLNRFESEEKTEKSLNKIIEAAKKVDDAFKTDKKDLAVYKGPIHDYTNAVMAEVAATDSGAGDTLKSLTGLENSLNELDTLVDTTATDADIIEDNINDLKTKFTTLHNTIASAIRNSTPEEKTKALELVKKFKKDRDDLITGIKNTTANDDSAKAEFKTFTKNISNENISMADLDASMESDYLNKLNDRLPKADEIINKFNNFLANYETTDEETAAKMSTSTATTDWEDKFKHATNEKEIAKLWDEYFNKEWGKNAQKVRALGQTFIQELLKAGFTEYTNPFITFVKNNINKLNLTADTYPAIHNAYINDYIDNDTLKGKKTDNLLYNENLYFNSAMDIFEYLKIQSDIDHADLPVKTTTVYTDKNNATIVCFDKSISVQTINDQIEAGKHVTVSGDLTTISLKKISQVKQALSLIGINASEVARKIPATDADVDRVYNTLKDQATIWQALLYLATTSDPERLQPVLDKIKKPSGVTPLDPSTNNGARVLNKIKDAIKNLSFKNLPDFMIKLAKKAGLEVSE